MVVFIYRVAAHAQVLARIAYLEILDVKRLPILSAYRSSEGFECSFAYSITARSDFIPFPVTRAVWSIGPEFVNLDPA